MQLDYRKKIKTEAKQRIQNDPMIKQLFDKKPADVIDYWNNANNQEKQDVMLRLLLIVQYLLKKEFE